MYAAEHDSASTLFSSTWSETDQCQLQPRHLTRGDSLHARDDKTETREDVDAGDDIRQGDDGLDQSQVFLLTFGQAKVQMGQK